MRMVLSALFQEMPAFAMKTVAKYSQIEKAEFEAILGEEPRQEFVKRFSATSAIEFETRCRATLFAVDACVPLQRFQGEFSSARFAASRLDVLMKRGLVLVYGVVCYLGFLGVFLYLLGFIGGFVTPTRLDSEPVGALAEGLVIDVLLVVAFGLQHSVMARPAFKRVWTRYVPEPMERSTYVLMTNLALALLFWQWRPLGGIVWESSHPTVRTVLWGLFAAGWLTVLVTTFLINHFDLFGLRQVWLYSRGLPYSQLPFVTPGPYRFVRHPLYVGWLLAFWATPMMTVTHLVFAVAMTAYILIAIWFEERDLTASRAGYADYRRRVPMLVPQIKMAATNRFRDGRSTENPVPT